MKVLQINNVPYGSTGKIMNDIACGLEDDGHKSIICYGRGPKNDNGIRVCGENYSHFIHFISRFSGYRYGGYFLATRKVIRIIKDEKPEIVHIQCINGNFVNICRLLEFLGKNNILTVITLHAEFMYTGTCGHAEECNKWKDGCGKCPRLWDAAESYLFDRTHQSWENFNKAYSTFQKNKLIFVAVSDWVRSRAMQSPLVNSFMIKTILNGINTEIFKRIDSEFCKKVLDSYDIRKKYILHVTALFDLNDNSLKGGRYILDLAERLKNTDYIIVIAAMFGFDTKCLPENVIYLGRTKSQKELAALYNKAEASLILSRRETFCMPVAESLSCGTPVAGFKAFGPESISIGDYTRFVDYANVDELYNAVLDAISIKKLIGSDEISKNSIEKYGSDRMYNEYLGIYNKLLSE